MSTNETGNTICQIQPPLPNLPGRDVRHGTSGGRGRRSGRRRERPLCRLYHVAATAAAGNRRRLDRPV